MDEGIKELVKQADRYTVSKNPGQDSYGRPENPEKFQQDRDNKFAGLVAQAVLDQLVAAGVLGTDGTAYRAVQARFKS